MEIFLDNKMIATALVPLSSLGEPSGQQFHIAVGGSPMVVDELRFSTGSLRPNEFLTKGEERSKSGPPVARNDGGGRPVEPARPGESPFQRSARELAERKAEEKAERERRRMEEARRRKEGFRR